MKYKFNISFFIAFIVCLLSWRFYLVGRPAMDLNTIMTGWEAFASGKNPYQATFGVNYPPAMQWIGGQLVHFVGINITLIIARSLMVVGCILGCI